MTKYSNLAVMNATKAADAAAKEAWSSLVWERVYDQTLAAQPEENFYTGAVYDEPAYSGYDWQNFSKREVA